MKEWSAKRMQIMIDQSKLPLDWRAVKRLSDCEYNELGDWLYYKTHKDEKDSRTNRDVPHCYERIVQWTQQQNRNK